MSDMQRLTNSSDETELAQLLSGDLVFNIPYFQRAYKWKPERLKQLEEDLLAVIDTDGTHFLGAIIVYARRTNPADPNVYEIIDGQQRITTVFLYICAIVKTLCSQGEYDEAAGLFLKYLAIGVGRDSRLPSNSKLHCCKEDRAQLNRVFSHIFSDANFALAISPFKVKPLPSTGSDGGRLWNNFRSALRFLAGQVELEGVDRLRGIYSALLGSVSVVQIIVRNPIDGPKIFNSLNSRQEPITTGDLVRNEIFAKVASQDPEAIETIDQNSWQPFYVKFSQGEGSLFDDYFFPFGLIHDQNVRKSEVFEKLRERWKNLKNPSEVIHDLSRYQDAFLDAVRGTNTQNHALPIATAFRNLHRAGAPGSTHPFLMQLSEGLRSNEVDKKDGIEVLELVEAFLVRRAICGHEPTGLHAVFKRLWQDCDGMPTRAKVETSIRRHRTVVWPTDEDVTQAVTSRPMYGSTVTPFLLLEWNRYLGGDQPQVVTWIEHVLPSHPSDSWLTTFSKEQHESSKDLLANLLPLSQEMNRELGNGGYESKRPIYNDDSGFKAARAFSKENTHWNPEALARRSELLSSWVNKRWSILS